MAYYDEQLKQLQQQAARKKRIEAELTELNAQLRELSAREFALKAQKLTEQADVDRLEGRSLAAFFYNVVGKKDERLDRERQEAYAASVKYHAAARELKSVQEDIQCREAELRELAGCEQRYAETLQAKSEEIKASGTPDATEILHLEESISYIEGQKREIREAISAGQTALRTAKGILSSLDSAKGWGTWDLFGGGLISGIAKHSHLDEAQGQVEQLQGELRRFKTELTDVTIHADMQVSIDGFLRFADYFFDGLFADWAVLDQINRSLSHVQNTKDQIEGVIGKLDAMLAAAEQERTAQKSMLDGLIMEASV